MARKSRSRKGNNGIADQILQNAPESCRVRIISEGKEVNEQMKTMTTMMSSPSPRANANSDHASSMVFKEEDRRNDSVSCICFKPMFRWPGLNLCVMTGNNYWFKFLYLGSIYNCTLERRKRELYLYFDVGWILVLHMVYHCKVNIKILIFIAFVASLYCFCVLVLI